MKKTGKILSNTTVPFALALGLLALLLLLAGCQSEMDRLLGDWYFQTDISPMLAQRLEEESPELADDLTLPQMMVTVRLSFYADGTYQAEVEGDSVRQACREIRPMLEQGIWDYMQGIHDQKDTGMTLEDYLHGVGITREQIMEEVIGDTLADELILEMRVQEEGRFSVEKGKLAFSGGLDREPEEVYRYQLTEESLTLEPDENTQPPSEYASALPAEFQRK